MWLCIRLSGLLVSRGRFCHAFFTAVHIICFKSLFFWLKYCLGLKECLGSMFCELGESYSLALMCYLVADVSVLLFLDYSLKTSMHANLCSGVKVLFAKITDIFPGIIIMRHIMCFFFYWSCISHLSDKIAIPIQN